MKNKTVKRSVKRYVYRAVKWSLDRAVDGYILRVMERAVERTMRGDTWNAIAQNMSEDQPIPTHWESWIPSV